jgi:hypothetical protein
MGQSVVNWINTVVMNLKSSPRYIPKIINEAPNVGHEDWETTAVEATSSPKTYVSGNCDK